MGGPRELPPKGANEKTSEVGRGGGVERTDCSSCLDSCRGAPIAAKCVARAFSGRLPPNAGSGRGESDCSSSCQGRQRHRERSTYVYEEMA
eukprot:3566914-Pyramimonas_sp.AAC.1